MTQQESAKQQLVKSANTQRPDSLVHPLKGHRPASTSAPTPPPNLSQATVQRTLANPRALSPNEILQLQRTAGNHAVQRMLNPAQTQAKMPVRPARDPYEQEADQMADSVMARKATPLMSAPALQATPAPTIQRKMAFGTEQLKSRSTKGKIKGVIAKTGIPQDQTFYEAIRSHLEGYENSHFAAQEVGIMLKMQAMITDWEQAHAGSKSKDEQKRWKNLQALQKAIDAELPKARTQESYVTDLQEEFNSLVPGSKTKPGSKFQYLSHKARLQPIDQARTLAKGETREKAPGMSKTTLELVNKYKLTDAEIAALQIYTVDDFKYINPAQEDKDTTLTQQDKDNWLKSNLPNITEINSGRGGGGGVNSYKDNIADVSISRGALQEGFEINVYRQDPTNPDKSIFIGRCKALKILPQQGGVSDAEKGFVKERVRVLLDGNLDIKLQDTLAFADTSQSGMDRAKLEGRRHGEIAKQGMAKLPDAKGTFYRGMTIAPDVLENVYAKGKIVEYGNFTSTTTNMLSSLEFIKREIDKDKQRGGKKVGMLLRLDLKENAKDLSDFSLLGGEKEILVMPGSKFKVTYKSTGTSNTSVGNTQVDYYTVNAEQVVEKKQEKVAPSRPQKVTPPKNGSGSGSSSEDSE